MKNLIHSLYPQASQTEAKNSKSRLSPNRSFRRGIATATSAAVILLTSNALRAVEGIDVDVGGPGDQAGKFADLRDITCLPSGDIYTLEGSSLTKDRKQAYPGNVRVQWSDSAGKPLGQFALPDAGKSQPEHLAAIPKGLVYVTYPTLGEVRCFSSTGKLESTIKIPGANAICAYPFAGKGRVAVLAGTQHVVNSKLEIYPGDTVFFIEDGKQVSSLKLERALSHVDDVAADSSGNLYAIADLHALYEFNTSGAYVRSVGAQTKSNATDGSEVRSSVCVDSKGNVYTMAGDSMVKFDPAFSTIAKREVRLRWFEPWGLKLLAIDGQDRIWGANPDLVTHELFDQFHARPALLKLTPEFFAPDALGVQISSAFGIGLRPSIHSEDVTYNLEKVHFDLVFPKADRLTNAVNVVWLVRDAYGVEIAQDELHIALTNGEESKTTCDFLPPRFGWYSIQATLSSKSIFLTSIGKNIGITPEFTDMPKYENVAELNRTNDAPKQRFVGLNNMRLNVNGGKEDSMAVLDKVLTACAKYGTIPFVQLTEETDTTPETLRIAINRFKGRVKYWEIINEPNLRMGVEKYAPLLVKTAQLIKEIDPDAKIMGPAVCGIDMKFIQALYKAGAGKSFDILSVHDYEGHESIDPIHWRWKFAELKKLMAENGDQDKPIWQTERVIAGLRGETFFGLKQAIRLGLHRDLLETLGVSPDHNNHYYLNSMGFNTVPSWIWDSSGPFPGAMTLRTREALTRGLSYSGTRDFGGLGNRLLSCLEYANSEQTVLVLRSEGSDTQHLTATTTAKELVVTDSWGNRRTIGAANGQVPVEVDQLPIYLEVVKGQRLDFPQWQLGRNLAERATVTYSNRSERPLSLVHNGVIEVIHAGNPTGGTDGANIWTGDIPENSKGELMPQHLDFTFDAPQVIETVIVSGLRGDNQFSALESYDLDARIGGEWTSIAQVRDRTPKSISVDTFLSRVMSWDQDNHLFVHRLNQPIVADAIRITIQQTGYGFSHDALANKAVFKAWGGSHTAKVMIREVEICAPLAGMVISPVQDNSLKKEVFPKETIAVTVTNTRAEPLSGLLQVIAPKGWTVTPPSTAITVEAGITISKDFQVTPPAELAAGSYFIDFMLLPKDPSQKDLSPIDVISSAVAKASLGAGWKRYEIQSPITLTPGGARDVGGKNQAVVVDVRNTSDQPASGTITAHRVDIGSAKQAPIEQPFGPVAPGKMQTITFGIPTWNVSKDRVQIEYTASSNHISTIIAQDLNIRQWNVIGHWEKDFDKAFGPELTVAKGVDTAKSYTDGMGNEQKWTVITSDSSGYMNLLSMPGPKENITVYAANTVTVPMAMTAMLIAGTDDSGKIWLNGDLVAADKAAHDSKPGQIRVPVKLKVGKNQILIKIVQGSFNWGFHFELMKDDGQVIPDLVYSIK